MEKQKKILPLILIILTILSILASGVISFTVTNENVKRNYQDIYKLDSDLDDVKQKVNNNQLNIAVLNTISEDIKEMKRDIKDIKDNK